MTARNLLSTLSLPLSGDLRARFQFSLAEPNLGGFGALRIERLLKQRPAERRSSFGNLQSFTARLPEGTHTVVPPRLMR